MLTDRERNQMEENPSRASRKNGTHQAWRAKPTRKSPYPVDDGGDLIECSAQYCKSCTAGLVADCVAVCCCPCALVNLLALAFVKVPWMVGRRCLGFGKRKGRRVEMKRKCDKSGNEWEVDRDGNLKKVRAEEGKSEIMTCGFGEEEGMENVCARYEAERVWLELYQVGHLGFGRVSFTGIQSQGKGN